MSERREYAESPVHLHGIGHHDNYMEPECVSCQRREAHRAVLKPSSMKVERDKLQARLDAVLEMHGGTTYRADDTGELEYGCCHCQAPDPCDTRRAAGAER